MESEKKHNYEFILFIPSILNIIITILNNFFNFKKAEQEYKTFVRGHEKKKILKWTSRKLNVEERW